MTDIFLFQGEANPADITLRDPRFPVVAGTVFADLAATEAQDVAAFATQHYIIASLDVVEEQDFIGGYVATDYVLTGYLLEAANIDAQRISPSALSPTEAKDVAAFSSTLVHTTALAAVETQDYTTEYLLAGYVAPDYFNDVPFSLEHIAVAELVATEAPDIASFGVEVQSTQSGVDGGVKLRKAAKKQRYIYRRERTEEQVSEPVAEAIERVVEHFEETETTSLAQAAALLALELDERGVSAAQRYTDILLEEIARLRAIDDDDEINAVLIELLR